jgi:hypothetical protein
MQKNMMAAATICGTQTQKKVHVKISHDVIWLKQMFFKPNANSDDKDWTAVKLGRE